MNTNYKIPLLKEILLLDDVYAIRKELNNMEKILSLIKELQKDQKHELLNNLKSVSNSLLQLKKSIQQHLETIEYKNGCHECGAQPGEDCRKIDEIGYCPSWDDYKKENNIE
jgi:hypothetical protein